VPVGVAMPPLQMYPLRITQYQRQTVDQPAKNIGTLYQLSVVPVELLSLDTTHFQQDNQCTYKATLRCARPTIFALEKQ